MESINGTEGMARLYYSVAEQCGIMTKLPHSKSQELFCRLKARLKNTNDIFQVRYLQAQFFRYSGKHLCLANIGNKQDGLTYDLYCETLLSTHSRQSFLRKLKSDASLFEARTSAWGTRSIRDWLLYRKPDSSAIDPSNMIFTTHLLSPAFLSISRSYMNAYRTMGEYKNYLPDPKNLFAARWFIMVTKELRNYCERNFGEECNFPKMTYPYWVHSPVSRFINKRSECHDRKY